MPFLLPIEGGCRCGRIRFRIDATPMMTMACHCRGCQQMSGSAFSLNVAVPSAALIVTQGEPVIGGLHGEQVRHHHCDHCKSWLFTRIEPDPGFANVRVGALDTPEPFAPFIETWTDEALPWAMTPARHRYPQFPPAEAFGPLLADYAATQAG
ncbi:aldehyde-activating protein [Sphingomonas sp. Leaf22]|uniref:GFA family protein n=2 Tax=unclassified Sphingomonas TaxID=196159 RepID=UPI0006F45B9B|nr:GFA family protein [Sphingomonas sp. Leaf22]KQM84848.1 aldehyde-activating protein [Sphingomonas sp. Leaf22]